MNEDNFHDLKIAEMEEIGGLSRDFFPPTNIHKYIFQDFGNVCAGVNGNRNSSPSRERKEVNTGSVKSRGSTVQINLGYGPNTFEDSRRASSSVSQVWRVCISPSLARHPIFVAREKRKKIFEKKERETEKLDKAFFLLAPPLENALKNLPLRKISLDKVQVQRGYNISRSVPQFCGEIRSLFFLETIFLFFFFFTNFY